MLVLYLAPSVLTAVVGHIAYRFLEPRNIWWHLVLLVIVPLSLTPLLVPYYPFIILAALAAWSSYVITLVICTIAHRLSPFHPLAKYPGPYICKITKIHFALVSVGGKQHIYFNKLHRQYGDIVRTGPNELSLCTPELIAPMLGPRGMPKAECKAYFAFVLGKHFLSWAKSGMANLQNRHKKNSAHLLVSGIPESTHKYVVYELEASLRKRCALITPFSTNVYDVMSDMAFGDDAEMMRNQDSMGFWKTMEESMPTGMVLAHIPWLTHFVYIIPGVAGKIKTFREFARQRVLRRLERGPTTQDLFYHLMDEGKLDPTPPAIEQVVSDASLTIVAGSDTVSPALCSLFYFIICNPIAYSRLQTEIDNSRISPEDVQGLSQLPYLNAALKETLRIIPPVLSGVTRAPLPGSGGFMLGSHLIPEGTTTGMHVYTLHRDPRNLFLPNHFIPERWLPVEQQIALEPELFQNREEVIHKPNAFIPFSYGPADCVGKRFAWQEMRALVCAVLQRFDLQFAEGYERTTWEGEMYDYFVLKKAPLPVVLIRRPL